MEFSLHNLTCFGFHLCVMQSQRPHYQQDVVKRSEQVQLLAATSNQQWIVYFLLVNRQ